MNLAHVHLLLNHFPVIAVPIGMVFLIHSLWTSNIFATKFAYLFLFVTSLSVIAVYLTGEPAEKVIKHFPSVTEAFIEPHEEAALFALILTLIMGAASFIAMLIKQDGTKATLARNSVITASLLAIGALSYTAFLGGQVRHTEIRKDFKVPSSSNETGSSNK